MTSRYFVLAVFAAWGISAPASAVANEPCTVLTGGELVCLDSTGNAANERCTNLSSVTDEGGNVTVSGTCIPAFWGQNGNIDGCLDSFYGTNDGCDCGCEAPDPDCRGDANASACVFFTGCTSRGQSVDPTQNALCVVSSGKPVCGDGVINVEGETCDDGAQGACNGDCTGGAGDVCGDGNITGFEQCDEGEGGNVDDGRGCSSTCKLEIIVIENGWTCDPTLFGTNPDPITYASAACDCGCGIVDPNCVDATAASCDRGSGNHCGGGVPDGDANNLCVNVSVCGDGYIDPNTGTNTTNQPNWVSDISRRDT